jgi:predicted AlkP superfamily pyrophosphatase or phosphodiesterase
LKVKIFIFVLLAAGCNTPPKETYPGGIEHVIVIGVDGMSPDGIHHANTPNMNRMIANGAVKWNVRTVLPTSSSPNWASMIMGAGPEQHGVIDNDWERTDHALPPVVMGEEGIFPTIFGVIRQHNPAAEIGAVYHWAGFGRLFEGCQL